MRIAIGGFQHETNTFAPLPATLTDFEAPDAWPGLTRGEALLEAVAGINLPAAGFIDEARSLGHRLAPLSWCSATPSAQVTRPAYEHIAGLLLEDLRSAGPIDAVYLDLHGAMVAEHIDDGDGELLHRVRQLVGDSTPVVASLDFHANVSPLMTASATALVAYRSYPHVDMTETGVRAMRCLHELAERRRPAHALQQLPFLIPLTSQCTLVEPMRSVMDEVAVQERVGFDALAFTPGFPAADVAECGPAVFGYGADSDEVCRRVAALARQICEREAEFALDVLPIAAALRELDRAPLRRGAPVILADTQDNPGAGGNADTTSLLKALLGRSRHPMLAGVIWDAEAAARAHSAGIGAQLDLALGAKSGVEGETPLAARFTVTALGDGRFTATGPFYLGARMDLGRMALLRCGQLSIAVASRKQQAADQAMFRHLGAEPRDFAVVVLKSSVHFRADFGPIAGRVLVVAAPGPNIADPGQLPFRKLRPGMRVAGRR